MSGRQFLAELGTRKVDVIVVEDRGLIGAGGRRLVRVRTCADIGIPEFEIPLEQLQVVEVSSEILGPPSSVNEAGAGCWTFETLEDVSADVRERVLATIACMHLVSPNLSIDVESLEGGGAVILARTDERQLSIVFPINIGLRFYSAESGSDLESLESAGLVADNCGIESLTRWVIGKEQLDPKGLVMG